MKEEFQVPTCDVCDPHPLFGGSMMRCGNLMPCAAHAQRPVDQPTESKPKRLWAVRFPYPSTRQYLDDSEGYPWGYDDLTFAQQRALDYGGDVVDYPVEEVAKARALRAQAAHPADSAVPPECPCCKHATPHVVDKVANQFGSFCECVGCFCRKEFRDSALRTIEEAVRWATNDHRCKPPLGNPTREEAIAEVTELRAQLETERALRLTTPEER